jgi:ABC-2 type transport system permease protein
VDGIFVFVKYGLASLRADMQYPASFFMLIFGHAAITCIEFLGLWALFDRFGSIQGWIVGEVALLYGMANISFALADMLGRGFKSIPDMIRTGDFDRILLRPRLTFLQVLGQQVELYRVGRLVQGLVVLAWGFTSIETTITIADLFYLLLAITGGACLFIGVFALQATMAFWTVEGLEVGNILNYGGVQAAQYPLDIYQRWFRNLFTYFIPIACLNYYPIILITQKRDLSEVEAVVMHAAPVVGCSFLVICLLIWCWGVRHYCSTGS